ncbi:MAG: ParE family toxin-like protein [Limisphaerales bacterium]
MFESNHQHPSLHFERKTSELWSARVGGAHRALARQMDDNLIWFWIGSHDEYERLLRDV